MLWSQSPRGLQSPLSSRNGCEKIVGRPFTPDVGGDRSRRRQPPGGCAMETIDLTFADLIAPLSLSEFFAETWEQKPLHIRRSPSPIYDTLLTAGDVETAITSGGLRYPAIQLAKSGAFFPAETFCRSIRSGDDVFSGVPDLSRVQSEYQAGATISLPGFHRSWGPLGALAAAVEGYFDHAVHTNVYITPGNSAGFTPHYDTHDVFILQISGAKHWRIYNPPLTLPHRTQPFSPSNYRPSDPLLEVDLVPGDLLYLPRGFVHSTTTSDAASMHVTLGVTVYTWVDLMAEWLQTAKNDPRFRRALPPGFAKDADQKPALMAEFAQLLSEFQDGETDHLIDPFLKKVGSNVGGTGGRFDFAVAAIGSQSKLRMPRPTHYTITEIGGEVAIKFNGKALTLPAHLRPTLECMGKAGSFCSADLASHLGEDAKLALVRHLHKEGLLLSET
jgi:hypothetical protein